MMTLILEVMRTPLIAHLAPLHQPQMMMIMVMIMKRKTMFTNTSHALLLIFTLIKAGRTAYIVFILRHTAAAHSCSLFSVDTVTVTYSLIFSPGIKGAHVD